jgi:hypothetical protein
MRALAVFIVVLQIFGATSAQSNVTDPSPVQAEVPAQDAFAQLIQLVGVWRPADNPDSPLRIHFALTAGGTVLVESWEVRGKPHSLTLFHRDGKSLVATHYCPQGNQPRLQLTGHDADGLHFAFRDVTDLDLNSEAYLHDLWIDLSEADHPVLSETYASKEGLGARERMRLVSASKP